MKNIDWLKNITQGKGREIARLYFISFTTQENLSKFLYPKRKRKAIIILWHTEQENF